MRFSRKIAIEVNVKDISAKDVATKPCTNGYYKTLGKQICRLNKTNVSLVISKCVGSCFGEDDNFTFTVKNSSFPSIRDCTYLKITIIKITW